MLGLFCKKVTIPTYMLLLKGPVEQGLHFEEATTVVGVVWRARPSVLVGVVDGDGDVYPPGSYLYE